MYSLVIIGGGIHGSMLFTQLPEKLRKNTLVIDKYEYPLFRFIYQCKKVGVTYLRSPASHCINEQLNNLFIHAQKHGFDDSHFLGRYYTPSLKLFLHHTQHLLQKHNIKKHWMQSQVQNLIYKNSMWIVKVTDPLGKQHDISAKRVLLALGMDAPAANKKFPVLEPQQHVLNRDFTDPPTSNSVAVIGGGMSGTQLALHLAKKKQRKIALISPMPRSITHFDSNPCFIGPKCLPQFLKTKSYTKRAELLKANRFPGTINKNVFNEYCMVTKHSPIQEITKRVVSIEKEQDAYTLEFSDNLRQTFQSVVLATGLSVPESVPHRNLISNLIKDYNLPHAKNKFPTPLQDLEWGKCLYVTGALAELELGPASRNIIGAHLAYRRLKKVWGSW